MRIEGLTYPFNSRTAITDQPVKPLVREPGSGDAEGQQYTRKKGSLQEGLSDGSLSSRREVSDEVATKKSVMERQREELKDRLAFLKEKEEHEEDEKLLDKLNGAIEEMNKDMEVQHLSLRFKLHEDSERWMVRIVDIMEDEVIREIPPERMLELSARIQSSIGVMLDRQS
ncbi:MAG: flagellar protein FlaG [Bacillota bacterium]